MLSALLALYDGNLPVNFGFPTQRAILVQNFDSFFDASMCKLLNKQPGGQISRRQDDDLK